MAESFKSAMREAAPSGSASVFWHDAAARQDRVEYIRVMREGGRTTTEIGDALGISGQRVRQIAAANNVTAPDFGTVDPVHVIAALRRPEVATMRALLSAVGRTYSLGRKGCPVRGLLRELGLLPAALRLMRWRRLYPTRARYAALIRGEATRLGRTPTTKELASAMGVAPNVSAPVIASAFGSVSAAMRYCGLEPRRVGGAGHLNNRGAP